MTFSSGRPFSVLESAGIRWRMLELWKRQNRVKVAEGGGLLNRYTVKSCIGGSNPPLSASSSTTSLSISAYSHTHLTVLQFPSCFCVPSG
jgi:hypothetical protein